MLILPTTYSVVCQYGYLVSINLKDKNNNCNCWINKTAADTEKEL